MPAVLTIDGHVHVVTVSAQQLTFNLADRDNYYLDKQYYKYYQEERES